VSYTANLQQSSLISGADVTSPIEVPGLIQHEWSIVSGPYTSNTGNVWISRATPVSTPSISAKSPTGSDEHSIASISHVIPAENQTVHSPELGSSLTTHETVQPSQTYPFSGSPGFDSMGIGFNTLSSFPFETNSVSQPVSFLRDTSAGVAISNSPPNNSYRAKRYKRQDESTEYQHRPSASYATTQLSSQSFDQEIGDNIFGAGSPTGPERRPPVVSGHEIFYGFDCGTPDYDLNKNNDSEAIAPISPSEEVFEDDYLSPTSEESPIGSLHVRRRSSFTTGATGRGYYVTPVRVKIPRRMTPLPSTLLDNPMNLLYFHHFIDHTARILVPHDCDENAFLRVLPASKWFINPTYLVKV
jgi:hypothetical protein